MKALTLQPALWAWLIIHGRKRVENRTWCTHYRGPLVIHAGKSLVGDAEVRAFCRSIGRPVPDVTPTGAALGTVNLVDCFRWPDADPQLFGPDWADFAKNPFVSGPYCWVLSNVRPFPEPIPCEGAQGLWNYPSAKTEAKRRNCNVEAKRPS